MSELERHLRGLLQAMALESALERAELVGQISRLNAYLERACAENDDLRRQVADELTRLGQEMDVSTATAPPAGGIPGVTGEEVDELLAMGRGDEPGDDMNREFAGEGERIYTSSRGYAIVDPDGTVWECDMSGYRITALPDDAVELLPRPGNTSARLIGPMSRRIAEVSIALRDLCEAVERDDGIDMTPAWDRARAVLADNRIVAEKPYNAVWGQDVDS